MKLVFFIDSGKHIGGGTYAQFIFARQLARLGHEVTIFAGDRNFLSDELEDEPMKIFWKGSSYRRRLTNLWWRIYDVFYTKRYLRKNKPDWLIGYMRISAIRAVRLGEELDIPVANFVFETPDWIAAVMGKTMHGHLKRSWQETRMAYKESNILIPNSKLAGEELLRWQPGVHVADPVYPGVDVPEKKDEPNRDYDIIYVGRLQPHKNVDLILRSAKPEWKIAIIGSGEERGRLEEITAERGLNVDFHGAVTDEEKWNLLWRSKLMVFPSSFEGFGMPPLEALACGCNILCSDIPIFREVYGDEVEYFDPKSGLITDQIEQMLHGPTRKEESPLVRTYTWENSAHKIVRILESCEH